MNELVTVYNHQLVTDSRQVAGRFEKTHRDVLKAIRHLIEGVRKNSQTPMFYEATYVNEQNGQTYPMYYMNRDGFSLLVMGFTGQKALEWKLKFLEAFNAMEKEIRKQQAVPKISPNPHYRTRMIKTAVKDAAEGIGSHDCRYLRRQEANGHDSSHADGR